MRARELGQKADNPYVMGYARTWLTWPCTELGRFEEAIENGVQARALYQEGRVTDPYIYFHALFGEGYASWHKGDAQRTAQVGQKLIEFGKRYGNVRSLVSGHTCLGWRHLIIGEIERATQCFKEAVGISADPWYSQFPSLALCYGLISNGKIQEALPLLDQLILFSDDNGAEFIGEPGRFFKGLVSILSDQVEQGLAVMEGLLQKWQTDGCRLRVLLCGYVMARIYCQPSVGAAR